MADVRTLFSSCACSHHATRLPEFYPVEFEVLIDWYLDGITDAMSGCPERELALSHALRIGELHAMIAEGAQSVPAAEREHGA
jgi:hypothetical protein